MRQNVIDIDYKLDDPWVILSQIEQSIKRKIESVGTPLKEWDIKINRGILTGLNEAFIITKEKRDELVGKDPKSDEIIRPILRGKDIKRYEYDFQNLYLINTHNGYTDEQGNVIPPININDYPAIKEWLDSEEWNKNPKKGSSFKRLSERTDQGVTPYNLRSLAYMDDFSKQKILFSEMVSSPQFYLDSQKFLVNDTVTFISGENLETLTIFLNSKIIFSIFKLFYAGGGLGNSGIRMKKTFLQKLPLPRVVIQNDNSKDQEILISQALTLTDAEFDYLLEAFSI
ncbi:TaqI-like C-terminal specificity domain-containing protein [Lactococcus garvieae]|uniref:TaqI-like C-terminal specificity domain-containing protein n=1 Tax=Lactococcus garvieae TaxID=1363 RepID=UPI0002F8220C|nr:TaqI-like C-terminal specificity domain-containing protein [Lactococcus garvieae]